MTTARPRSEALPRPAAVVLALFAAACVGGQVADRISAPDGEWRVHQGGTMEWWSGRGLVVPHTTFPADCGLCHIGNTWSEMRADLEFDHVTNTGVALRGAHTIAQCLRCHNDRGPVSEFAARGCSGCHVDVHLGQRGAACLNCHTEKDWQVGEAVLAHAMTRFPLIGPHAASTCRQCHIGIDGGVLEPLDTDCASCHTDDLERATNPDHFALGWTSSCEDCHIVTSTFGGIGFTHTAFALTEGHAGLDCAECHAGGQFGSTPRMCSDCHLDDYLASTEPDHQALGLPTTCQDCHRTSSWQGAAFDHSLWALTGAHAAASCSACHAGGVFAGTPTACVDCHLAEYQATTDPDHQALGFPTTCQDCHGTAAWSGAAFDHTTWELTGAHATASCTSCHSAGVFAGTPTDCFACHEPEYNATTDPNHAALGFPTTCADCHGTTVWTGAQFDHVWFPIIGGDHGGFTCTECHQVPGDPNQFSCIHCHDHRQSEMDDEHEDVPGYVWQSAACYQCHPTGQEHAATSRGALFRRRIPDRRPAGRPTLRKPPR